MIVHCLSVVTVTALWELSIHYFHQEAKQCTTCSLKSKSSWPDCMQAQILSSGIQLWKTAITAWGLYVKCMSPNPQCPHIAKSITRVMAAYHRYINNTAMSSRWDIVYTVINMKQLLSMIMFVCTLLLLLMEAILISPAAAKGWGKATWFFM